MKESYSKALAKHAGHESCLDDPRGRGEALTGGSAGGLLSSEITFFRVPILWNDGEGNTDSRVNTQVAVRPGGVREALRIIENVVERDIPTIIAYLSIFLFICKWSNDHN